MVLAATGNFSRAAEARAIAQPALSRHIRSLEEWVGAELIDRSAHSGGLTAAGKRFQSLLVDVLSGLEAARIKARAAQDEASASLRFACTHVLSLYFFPRWLAQLEEKLQLGPVQTRSDSSVGCEELLLQRKVQFVLCYGAIGSPSRLDEGKYPMMRLGGDTLVPVSVPGHGGKPLHTVGGGDMLPVLAYSDASGAGRIMRTHLGAIFNPSGSSRAVQPISVVFTAHSAILLKTMALAGRGLAWLPLALIAEELSCGRLLDAGGGDWRVALEIRLYRQRAELAPVAEALWTLVGGANR